MKTKYLALLILLVIKFNSKGQDNSNQIETLNVEKAKLIDHDINEYFGINASYPGEAALNEIEGNVVVSFIINQNGQLDSIKIINNPSNILSLKVLTALEGSSGLWIPCKVDGNKISKRYIGSFKYLINSATSLTNYKNKGLKKFKKGDLKNALDYINKALKIDEYSIELYQIRSNIYLKLNEKEQAKNDIEKINNLRNNLLIDMLSTVVGIPRN